MTKIIKLLFRPENLQIWLVVLIILGAFSLSNIFSNSRPTLIRVDEVTHLSVSVVDVRSERNVIEITTTGRVTPRNTVAVTPEVSGRVLWVSESLHSGGYFKAHDVLFRIDKSDYSNALAKEQAAVVKAETELTLEMAEAHAALAEWKDLNPGQKAPPLVGREPQIAQVKAEVAAAQARLAQARLNLARTQYRLPFDGRVVHSSLALGGYLQAGQNYGELYSEEALEIVLSLPKKDMLWIHQPGHLEIIISYDKQDGRGGKTLLGGKILRTGASLDEATRFQQVIIKPGEYSGLLPGMLTDVLIRSAPVSNTWALPLSALQPGGMLWLIDSKNRLVRLKPDIVAVMDGSLVVRAPVPSARVVNSMLGGAIEGAEVVVVGGVQ